MGSSFSLISSVCQCEHSITLSANIAPITLIWQENAHFVSNAQLDDM